MTLQCEKFPQYMALFSSLANGLQYILLLVWRAKADAVVRKWWDSKGQHCVMLKAEWLKNHFYTDTSSMYTFLYFKYFEETDFLPAQEQT